MHRSGTSALTGALKLLGVDLGTRLVPPSRFNPEGHFENAEVVAHDERLLHALGSRWDDLRPLPPRWWKRRAVAALEAERRDLVRREFGGGRLWAVKDPRMCRLLPAWTGALRAAAAPCGYLLLARDPREVARSLAARDGFPAWKAHLLYLDHMLQAERATRGEPRAFLTYDELLRDGPSAFQRIGRALDLRWSPRVAEESARLRAFLQPGLRHHAAARTAPRSRLERLATECYQAFVAAAKGAPAGLPRALEPIATLLEEVALPWARGMTADADARLAHSGEELAAARRSVEALARQVEEARRAHQARDAADAMARQALADRDAEIGRARHSIEVLAGEIETARAAHQARDHEDDGMRQALRDRDAEVARARAHIEALTAEIARARAAHEVRDATEAELRAALSAREAEVEDARRNIASLAGEIDRARQAHEARDRSEAELRDVLRAREVEVDQGRLLIESLAEQVERARQDHAAREETEDVLRQELAARDREVEAARRHIEALVREIDGARRAHEARDRTEADLLRAAVAREEEARAARRSLEVLGRELAAARESLAERARREDELRRGLAAAESALQERADAMSRLLAELEEHVSLEHELEASLLDSEHALEDVERKLARRGVWRRSGRARPEAMAAAAAPAGSHFALDDLPPEVARAEMAVTGWHVPPAGRRLLRLVVRAGRGRFPSETGQHRPDVARAYPGLPAAAASGFTAKLRLPPGDHRLSFEAEYDDGTWHRLAARGIRVRRPELDAALDAPRSAVASGLVRFAGWCCHAQEPVQRLTLSFAGRTVDCAYGLSRPDVEAHYPDHPGSGASGFEATLSLPPARGHVTLRARLASGDELLHTSAETLVVLPRVLTSSVQGLQALARSGGVVRGVAAQLWRRARRGGPLPPVRAIPRRLADVVRLHRARARQPPAGALAGWTPPAAADRYACWLRVNAWHERARVELERRLAAHDRLPTISVLAALSGDASDAGLVASLQQQVYRGWELCVSGDGDDSRSAGEGIDASRLRPVAVPAGAGPAARLNAAAAAATGDFVLLCGQPLTLAPDALAELALYAAEHPDADIVYADHDRADDAGRRGEPRFKPGWSPELLLSCPYLGPAWIVRRSLFEDVEGLREDLRGAEDHDLALRASERARHVGHVPLVLFHERDGRPAEPAATGSAARAVSEAFERRGVPAAVDAVAWADGRPALQPRFPDDGPSVAMIVLPAAEGAKDSLDALRATAYRPLDVRAAGPDGRSRAALANAAAREATADYLLFVDAGAVPRDPAWLGRMMGYARLPGVGAVGARLLGSDGHVRHEGVVRARHGGRGGAAFLQGQRDGALHDARLAANRSAVSGACLLTPRRLFLEMGGFDAGAFAEAYHDLDYAFRLAQKGHRSVYVPSAELVLERDPAAVHRAQPQAEACFRRRHPARPDEFLSPYLVVGAERLELAPRRLAAHVRRPLRALLCSFNLNREGAPHVQLEMAARLKDMGVLDPVVFCHQDGPLREAYAARGITVHVGPHPLARVFDGRGYERAVASFAAFAQGTGAEVVYANTVHTFYAVAAARAAGLPSVWNLHESEPVETHFAHLAPEVATRALECFRHAYRVVFVAEATREVYGALASEHNFAVLHGALDMERLRSEAGRWPREEARRSLGLADGEVALLLLGTVCERKGQQDLPEALAFLPERLWPGVRCFIVGDRGLGYSRRVSRAREALPAGLRDRVELLPETAEPARFYQAADVFVCTSRVESFPRVTLEAMAHGLPLVTTPVYGIREQVRPGVNALVYEPGDTRTLGAEIVRLLEDPALRAALAGRARAVLECLDDFDAMVAGYGEIFREAWMTTSAPPAAPAGRGRS
jgi:glycosyltransferase involved in cell wall biosynthesis